MNAVKKLLAAIDRAQQHNTWLAIAAATWKKFGDDQAGNLAALIAYYAFASIFPLLLVAVTIINLIARHSQHLHNKLANALQDYPVIGPQLAKANVTGIDKAGLALVLGVILALLAARGVANAAQNALNSVWEIPMYRRPGFPWNQLRSLALVFIVGPGVLVTITLSSLAGGAGGVLSGAGAYIATLAVSLLLNIGLFWLGFRLATASEIGWRDLLQSAVLSAILWQVLQTAGGYFLSHQAKSNSAYGTFGVVLGLLAWFYLQAQLTLYVVELNVVRARHLWPRSMFPPPLTDADIHAYELYAGAEQRRKDVEILIRPLPEDQQGGTARVDQTSGPAPPTALPADEDGPRHRTAANGPGHRAPGGLRNWLARALHLKRRS